MIMTFQMWNWPVTEAMLVKQSADVSDLLIMLLLLFAQFTIERRRLCCLQWTPPESVCLVLHGKIVKLPTYLNYCAPVFQVVDESSDPFLKLCVCVCTYQKENEKSVILFSAVCMYAVVFLSVHLFENVVKSVLGEIMHLLACGTELPPGMKLQFSVIHHHRAYIQQPPWENK